MYCFLTKISYNASAQFQLTLVDFSFFGKNVEKSNKLEEQSWLKKH
jgi:hypothetical protein